MTDFAGVFEKLEHLKAKLFPITTSDDMEHTRELETKYARGRYPIYCDQEKRIFKQLPKEWVLHITEKLPAIFIIDKDGIIRESYYKEAAQELPKAEEIIEILKKLPK